MRLEVLNLASALNATLQQDLEFAQKAIGAVKTDLNVIRSVDTNLQERINETHAHINDMITKVTSAAESASSLAQTYYSVVSEIFFNIEDPRYPIDQNGMHSVPADCAIWSHPTDHYRYIDPYLCIENAQALFQDAASLGSVDVSAISRSNPEDMYVVSVLTRTILYAKTLASDDQFNRFYNVVCCIGELGDQIKETIHNLWDMDDLITSAELQEAKVRAINEPAIQHSIDLTVSRCIGCIDATETAINRTYNVAKLYDELNKLLDETDTAIQKSYAKYIECNHITF